jgi:hypothetical protein
MAQVTGANLFAIRANQNFWIQIDPEFGLLMIVSICANRKRIVGTPRRRRL